MIATFLTLFVAFAGCQALLTVKLADWLSADSQTGRGAREPVATAALA